MTYENETNDIISDIPNDDSNDSQLLIDEPEGLSKIQWIAAIILAIILIFLLSRGS